MHFLKVRTGWPDHGRTSHFDKAITFFQEFLLKTHLLRAYYLGFDISCWIVLMKSEILIMMGMVWPVSSDKCKASLDVQTLFSNLQVTSYEILVANQLVAISDPGKLLCVLCITLLLSNMFTLNYCRFYQWHTMAGSQFRLQDC